MPAMDKLLALKTLLEVSDASGFAKAAQRLGVATSSVMRLMDALEQDVGAVLLTRTPRRVSLTDAGATYVEQIAKVLDDLAEADESVLDSGAEPAGMLRIAVPSTYNRVVLAPHLAAFLQAHPRMTLDVVAADRYVDLALERIDLAVRIGLPDSNPQLVVKTLAENTRFVVASAGYLEREGVPDEPAGLAQRECLRVSYGGGYRARQVWTFTRGETQEPVNVRGRLVSDSIDMLFAAVLAGQGFALLPEWLVCEAIAAGQLVRVFDGWQVSPQGGDAVVHAAYLPNRRHSTKVRALLRFLEAHLNVR